MSIRTLAVRLPHVRQPTQEMAMRFLSMIRIDEKSGQKPSERLMTEMGKLMEEATREGWLVTTAGLRPTTEGKRMRWNRGKLPPRAGPFSATKEGTGGAGLSRAASLER